MSTEVELARRHAAHDVGFEAGFEAGRASFAAEAQEHGDDLPANISQWIDDSYPPDLDREAWMWRRVEKINEECGEVSAAIRAVVGENPRKGTTGTWEDVTKELCDVALAALCAIEHLTGNRGEAPGMLRERIDVVARRAGVSDDSSEYRDR